MTKYKVANYIHFISLSRVMTFCSEITFLYVTTVLQIKNEMRFCKKIFLTNLFFSTRKYYSLCYCSMPMKRFAQCPHGLKNLMHKAN